MQVRVLRDQGDTFESPFEETKASIVKPSNIFNQDIEGIISMELFSRKKYNFRAEMSTFVHQISVLSGHFSAAKCERHEIQRRRRRTYYSTF